MTGFYFKNKDAVLILEDGEIFRGYGIGDSGITEGEVCFNTSLTGYQEILTDPSYYKQIITFTFPHIGNVGVNIEDMESNKIYASGMVIREDISSPSNFRSHENLNLWLKKHHITAISGIDTRKLTRYIRANGAKNAVIAYGDYVLEDLITRAKNIPSMKGLDLAKDVSLTISKKWNQGLWHIGRDYANNNQPLYNIVVLDFGVKHNILRSLVERGCNIDIMPANSSYEEVMKKNPDAIFLSNGPGDPAATGQYVVPLIKKLIDSGLPIFGICLGHQMLALALGCKTEKMHQGHRGANHPVKNLASGKVEITSQNHGFVVMNQDMPADVEITHISLFDNSVEGIRLKNKPVFSVQYHPESSPGPHDSAYLFDEFIADIKMAKSQDLKQLKA